MDRNLPIGILDSGVGGLTAVVQMKNVLPDEVRDLFRRFETYALR